VNLITVSSFDIEMAQPPLRGAEKKMAARAAHGERAEKDHATRAAKRASKSQSILSVLTAGGASLDAAIATGIIPWALWGVLEYSASAAAILKPLLLLEGTS
jgi:hypothetical protein